MKSLITEANTPDARLQHIATVPLSSTELLTSEMGGPPLTTILVQAVVKSTYI